ncbi:MAG: hypothetical protein JO211_14360 [Acidobacteriaceae bacterium]|nr:hypothetical protein [Acidobacteriaceae bacterium]
MSKQDEAGLILKLYELRREPTMRAARDWFFRDFHPQSADEYMSALFSEQSGYVRMVVSYWDMAAGLVNSGAISLELFDQTNAEHFAVFSKIEPLLDELRATIAPQFAVNLEKLIADTPNGRDRVAMMRERMKMIRARMMEQRAAHAARN